jgi:hypothetical protein
MLHFSTCESAFELVGLYGSLPVVLIPPERILRLEYLAPVFLVVQFLQPRELL